jgi:hypothetical protein
MLRILIVYLLRAGTETVPEWVENVLARAGWLAGWLEWLHS